MALTESIMKELGHVAPDFTLPDVVTGNEQSYADIAGESGTLVMFICNHCPFVKHVLDSLIQLGSDYIARQIGVVAISSNDVAKYPEDAPDLMAELANAFRFPFPYLHDDTQAVAKAYGAACTPDFFLFDANKHCVYRGRLDGSTPGNSVANDGKDLRGALDALLADEPVPEPQLPSVGCNIKWK